jgi:hypothetical protein
MMIHIIKMGRLADCGILMVAVNENGMIRFLCFIMTIIIV